MEKILIDPEDWITIAEAARLRHISRQAISNLVRRGRLETLKIAGYTLVKKSSVLSFIKEASGRKKKA
ncbi:MAG: helix-turn-helix domain-containing protein [Nitrospiraceae bacterium]|nr:helix-turn-helix domain-containing protein [Nitrospiraceae bacterium]